MAVAADLGALVHLFRLQLELPDQRHLLEIGSQSLRLLSARGARGVGLLGVGLLGIGLRGVGLLGIGVLGVGVLGVDLLDIGVGLLAVGVPGLVVHAAPSSGARRAGRESTCWSGGP